MKLRFTRLCSANVVQSLLLVIAVMCACVAASGQKANTATTGSGQTATLQTFRSESRLVIVDVVAKDKSGNPASGLKADDFVVLENGKKQTIRFFQAHTAKDLSNAGPPALGPHQYTNIPAQPPNSPVNIIVLDALNTPATDQIYARKQMVAFLKTLPRGQRTALFTLGTSLELVQGFNADTDTLAQAAQNVLERPTPFLTTAKQKQGELEEGSYFAQMSAPSSEAGKQFVAIREMLLQRFVDEQSTAGLELRISITIEAMRALAQAVAGYSGRKNLLWVSGGFPFRIGPEEQLLDDPLRTMADFAPMLARLANDLAAAQVAVYPIDARGIVVITADATVARVADPGPNRFEKRHTEVATENYDVHGTMQDMAVQTGGEAFFGTNDLKTAMMRSVDRGTNYYTLAYVPTDRNYTGKYRKIEVKSSAPGLKLSHRRGYYGLREPKPAADQAARLLMAAVRPTVPPATSVLLQVEVLPPDQQNKNVRITYAVDPRGVQFVDTPEGTKRFTIDMLAVAWDKQNRDAGHKLDTIDAAIGIDVYEQVINSAIKTHQELALRPGNYMLRLGVLDRATQRIGTIDVPLTVPAAN